MYRKITLLIALVFAFSFVCGCSGNTGEGEKADALGTDTSLSDGTDATEQNSSGSENDSNIVHQDMEDDEEDEGSSDVSESKDVSDGSSDKEGDGSDDENDGFDPSSGGASDDLPSTDGSSESSGSDPSDDTAAPTQSGDKPIELPDEALDCTYEEYNAMTADEQYAFYLKFESMDTFVSWYRDAEAKYKKENPDVDIGEGGEINLGDIVG